MAATTPAAVATAAAASRYPALFICHGGGPMPLLNEPSQRDVVREWKKHVSDYLTERPPKAIVLVSAHYETNRIVGVGAAAKPKMIYDYGGFPPETYKIKYEAPGHPELAHRIVKLLTNAGIEAAADENRGYDHGVFVPLMIMFPEANIPVVPLSVLASQKADQHLAIGRALASLRDEGVLFLGSGSSSHYFGARGDNAGKAFNDHLTRAVTGTEYDTTEKRTAVLNQYLDFPGADEAQHRGAAEHLMPLFTVQGTSQEGTMRGSELANVKMASWNERHYLFEQ